MSVQISVQSRNDKVVLQAPYHPALPARARRLGGRWDPQARIWRFDARDEARVRDLAREVYGTDGAPVQTVTVRHTVTTAEAEEGSLWLFGREIASRSWKSDPVRLGPSVVFIEGEFPPYAGSRKYPRLDGAGTVLEIRDVPAALVTEDEHTTIVDTGGDRRQILEARIAELEEELATLREELAAL